MERRGGSSGSRRFGGSMNGSPAPCILKNCTIGQSAVRSARLSNFTRDNPSKCGKYIPMPTPSIAIIDALNSLLEAEVQSIFHFVGKNSPLLERAGAEVRQPLDEMVHHLDQHAQEVSHLIRHLGGRPSTPPAPKAEDQYLSFLSLRFLLPKLVDAKELMIQR